MDQTRADVSGLPAAAAVRTGRTGRRDRRWLAVLAGGVLVAVMQVVIQVGAATPAAAMPGVLTTTAFSAKDSTSVKGVSADCPTGTRLIGGGATVDDGLAGQVRLTMSAPILGISIRDYWEARAREPATGFSGAWRLKVVAICGPEPSGLETVWTSVGTTGTFQAATVGCPAGKRVLSVGGGMAYSQTQEAALQLVRPDGPLTLGRVTARRDNGSTNLWVLFIYVLCANPLPGQQNVAQVVNAADGYAYCPVGTSVIGTGGGGGLSDSGPYYLQTFMPLNNLSGSYAAMTGRPTSGTVIQATCAN